MIIALSISSFFITIVIIGKIHFSIPFNKQIEALFSQSKHISNKTFCYEKLSGLPEPVQRYFKHVLKYGQPTLVVPGSHIMDNLQQDWIKIGLTLAVTNTLLQRSTATSGGSNPMITAREMNIGAKGRLIDTLLSLVNILDGQGEEFNEGEKRVIGTTILDTNKIERYD